MHVEGPYRTRCFARCGDSGGLCVVHCLSVLVLVDVIEYADREVRPLPRLGCFLVVL